MKEYINRENEKLIEKMRKEQKTKGKKRKKKERK